MKIPMEYYKPTKNAWIAVSVVGGLLSLSVAAIAITWIVKGGHLNLESLLNLQIGSEPVKVEQHFHVQPQQQKQFIH